MKKCEKFKKEFDIKAYINPEISEQHKEKGIAFFQSGDFPSAMKEFEEGLRRDPKNKTIYNNRCACFIKLMEPN
jgi:stress-induced-phosphoprotein 1